MSETEEILLTMIKHMVDEPDEVQLHMSEEIDDKKKPYLLINVKVADKDIGAAIGRGGVIAKATREVIGVIGFREFNKRVFVRIDAPELPKNFFYKQEE